MKVPDYINADLVPGNFITKRIRIWWMIRQSKKVAKWLKNMGFSKTKGEQKNE